MSGYDLPLQIPVSSIADYLSCPVCMCDLTDTCTTPCGHRYCEKCIKECVGRHHKCPCCNKQIQVEQLIRDPQFDELINIVRQEKEKSEKSYFDNLINTASEAIHGCGDTELVESESRRNFSPVETVLKKHLKASLSSHEKFYQDLKIQSQRKIEQVESECQNMIESLHRQSLKEEELQSQTQELNDTCASQKLALQKELDTCANLVAQAFDRYLSEHIPNVAILPVHVTLNILSKNITIPDVTIKPQDSTEDIRKLIEEHMEGRGDKIIKYSEDAQFICFGPFSKTSALEMQHTAMEVVQSRASVPDVYLLPPGVRPVLQFQLIPGSHIALYGQIQCASDMPKSCFASTFQQGAGQAVDYFSCKNCNFNWVCRSCMEVCHRDHNIVPYIMNHKPTWACCYCPKKKKCRIQSQ